MTPSTQPRSDTSTFTGAIGDSKYAVTYRRGTGVVSGSAGNQITSTALDLEGLKSTSHDTFQSRSPGDSAKMSRRAAMHITGPSLVTVPLHITTNLAFGVLQREGGERVIHYGRDKDEQGNVPDAEIAEEMKIKNEQGEKNDTEKDTETCGQTAGENEESREKQQEKPKACGNESEMAMARGSTKQSKILSPDFEEANLITNVADNAEASEYMGNYIYLSLLPPHWYYQPFLHLSSHASITALITASNPGIHPCIHAFITFMHVLVS